MSELELLPWPALAAILRELGFDEIRCLSLTCTKLYSAVAELATPEVKVVLPGSLDLPLNKPLLGLKVEIGDLFSESSWIDLEQLESLSRHPNYKVAKIKLGGGLESNPEQNSQAAHFLLSHHYLNSLLTAHSRARKKISHLDFEIDLLCFGCKKLLNEMQGGPSADFSTLWSSSISWTVRIVNSNTGINSNTITTGLVVHFLRAVFGLPFLKKLKVFNIPSNILDELMNDWFAPDRLYFSRLRTFQLEDPEEPGCLSINFD